LPLEAAVERFRGAHGIIPDLLLALSPYHPLRHPERGREALDTLLMHGLDGVVSVGPGRAGVIPGTVGTSALACWPWDYSGSVIDVQRAPRADPGPFWALDLDRWRKRPASATGWSVAAVETLGLEAFWVTDQDACKWAEAVMNAGFPTQIAPEEFLWPAVGTR
jgi:hypothetical protein